MSKNAMIGIGALILLVLVVLFLGMREQVAEAPSGGVDMSDQALRDEAAAIDAGLEGLEGDRAMIDQGLESDVSAQ